MNRARVFLKTFRITGNVTKAAAAAQIDRAMHYRRLKTDPAYAREFADASQEAIQVLEDEANRRAVEGVLRPVFWQGQACGATREYSDSLLQFLLRGRRPEMYRERYQVQHSGQMGVQFEGTLVELLAVYQQLTAEEEHAAAEQQPAKTRRPRD